MNFAQRSSFSEVFASSDRSYTPFTMVFYPSDRSYTPFTVVFFSSDRSYTLFTVVFFSSDRSYGSFPQYFAHLVVLWRSAEGTLADFVFLLLTRHKMPGIFCSCFVRRFGKPQASLVFRSLIRTLAFRRRYFRSEKPQTSLVFRSLSRTFAAENKMWIDLGCLQPLKKMLKNKSSWLDCIVTPNSFPLLIINFSKIKLH